MRDLHFMENEVAKPQVAQKNVQQGVEPGSPQTQVSTLIKVPSFLSLKGMGR